MEQMKSERIKEFDKKIALSFGAIVLLMMLMAVGITVFLFNKLQQREEDRLSSTIAMVMSQSINKVSFSGKYQMRLLVEQMLTRVPELVYISVESKDNIILAHSDPVMNDRALPNEETIYNQNCLDIGKPFIRDQQHNQLDVKEVTLPYQGGFNDETIGVVKIAINLKEVRKAQKYNLIIVFIISAVLTLLAIALIVMISRYFGKSIRSLAYQLEGILDHAPIGIIISDQSGKIHVHGQKIDDLTGLNQKFSAIDELYHLVGSLKEEKNLKELDSKVIVDGQSLGMEINGSIHQRDYYWQISKFPIAHDINNQVTLICTFIHDISERKKTEVERENLQNQLLQSRKMESVGRLAGGVAHDFNNMLSAIIGYSQLMLLSFKEDTQNYQYLNEILKAANRSADLTRQLLAFARKQEINPQILLLNNMVESMLNMLQRLIGEHIRLEWKPGEYLGAVKIDPSQVDQIIANLTVNARDAIDDTGTITIETANIIIDEEFLKQNKEAMPGEYVMLSVIDDGCGIEPKDLEQIFEPFFTTKELGQGTGLGLATVYGIVKQNNGFIQVNSKKNKGTSFRVYFPRFESKDSGITLEKDNEIPQGSNEKILLVEDEEAVLNFTKEVLEHLGYQVFGISNAPDALDICRQNREKFDLLLTDVIMPEMNGKELAIQAQLAQPGIKCIYMSGYTSNVIAKHGVFEGSFHFLQKPFTIPTLAQLVHSVLKP